MSTDKLDSLYAQQAEIAKQLADEAAALEARLKDEQKVADEQFNAAKQAAKDAQRNAEIALRAVQQNAEDALRAQQQQHDDSSTERNEKLDRVRFVLNGPDIQSAPEPSKALPAAPAPQAPAPVLERSVVIKAPEPQGFTLIDDDPAQAPRPQSSSFVESALKHPEPAPKTAQQANVAHKTTIVNSNPLDTRSWRPINWWFALVGIFIGFMVGLTWQPLKAHNSAAQKVVDTIWVIGIVLVCLAIATLVANVLRNHFRKEVH